ncbi:chitin binding peritrophin-A domain-containing protein [Thioclava sp. F36-6]|uniref:chitin binding peritrophin-A domain-containing protein n=1 Tax=Thioclava sp. F36-6 TaxID=1915316 RepID=UPI0011BA9F0E|nr:chitin binding peritrophin-A domain-containing protein [Thioclava sp. F36-6]
MTRTILAAAVLILAPLAASAECFSGHQASMSCPQGQVWDKDANACVLQSS